MFRNIVVWFVVVRMQLTLRWWSCIDRLGRVWHRIMRKG